MSMTPGLVPPRLRLAACFLAIALAVAPLRGEDSTSPAPVFGEVVDVHIVNVDVYVTDRQGRPVTGLAVDDFELFEDRRPITISNFYAVEGGESVVPPTVESEGDSADPPPQVAPMPGAAVPPEQQLHLIVYIDNFNLRPFNRNRVLRSLREFLQEHVRPGDETMVVSYDRSFNIRQPFTSDANTLSRTLLELETVSAHAVHLDSDRRDLLEAIQEAEHPSQVLSRIQTFAESTFNDLAFTIDSMRDFVGLLAGLPGRKALLYVSDGIPQRPGEDLYYAVNNKFDQAVSLIETQRFDAGRRLEQLATLAASHRVSFYTIEATGLRPPSSASVMSRDPGTGSIVDSVYMTNHQAPLQMLAERTGGQSVLNANNVGPALERIAEDFSNYYSLGFRPSHAGDGRYHRIEVKVKGRGLRVRHRDGYRDETMESRMNQSVLAGLTFQRHQNPLEVRIDTGAASRGDDGHFQVPVSVLLPLDRLTLVPNGEERFGRVRLYLAARDARGDMSPVQQAPLEIRIPEARWQELAGEDYAYEMTLTMRGGEHHLAVGVRDEIGSTTSVVVASVVPGG